MLQISPATLWSIPRWDAGISYSVSPRPVKTDRKFPDSSIPDFQQEAATLEVFWKSTFFIRIKIYWFNSKYTLINTSYLQT